MPNVTTGVFPVWKNKFEIGESEESLSTIAGMETFSIAIDGKIEEWTTFENEGWTSRLMTGKSLTVSPSGKRVIGDTGNDLVANTVGKTGTDCNMFFRWTLPDGSKIAMSCVISLTDIAGGDSTAVGPIAFDAMSNGKPTFTPAA